MYVNRLFFKKDTGELVYRYSMQGDIIISDVAEDTDRISILTGCNADSLEVIEVQEDDTETINNLLSCTGITLSLVTKELVFDYTPVAETVEQNN